MTNDEDGGIPATAERASRDGDSALAPQVDPTATAVPASPSAPQPDLSRTADALARPRSQSIETTVLTVLAVLFTMYVAREFLIPIVFALLLNFLLSPVIRQLTRLHIKPPLGAGLVVVLLVGGIGTGVYQLAGPAQRWAASAPQSFSKAQRRLRSIIQPMQQVSQNM